MLDHAPKGLYKQRTSQRKRCRIGSLPTTQSCVASLAHQSTGGPAVSTLWCGSSLVPLSPSVGTLLKDEIQCNLQAGFKGSRGELGYRYILLINEINVKERLQ